MRHLPAVVAAALAVAIVAAPACAERRVALVVGNSAYQNVARLDNPKNDAKLIAETLRGLGFTLVGGGAQLDLDKARLDRAVQAFGNQLAGADVALFYYAGHGVQVRGTNYLVPVNANPTKEADVDFQMTDVALVLRQMEGSGTKFNLLILDACRNNPFGGRGLRAAGGGLAQMQAPEGTLISYATQPGNVAQDGADGDSPYSKALAQTIQRPGIDIFKTFNEVGLAVKRATGGVQQPWLSTSPINGNFYFVALPAGSRLALALLADNPAKAAGTLLHDYGNASTTYAVERDITFPGDIENFAASTINQGPTPAIRISLAAPALERINRGGELLDRRIALVLDGRTVLASAVLRGPLSTELQLTGNFSLSDIKRLLDAVAANP